MTIEPISFCLGGIASLLFVNIIYFIIKIIRGDYRENGNDD